MYKRVVVVVRGDLAIEALLTPRLGKVACRGTGCITNSRKTGQRGVKEFCKSGRKLATASAKPGTASWLTAVS